jgi:hypothetical protein
MGGGDASDARGLSNRLLKAAEAQAAFIKAGGNGDALIVQILSVTRAIGHRERLASPAPLGKRPTRPQNPAFRLIRYLPGVTRGPVWAYWAGPDKDL